MEEALRTTFHRRSSRIATILILFLCGIAMPQFFWVLFKIVSPIAYYSTSLAFFVTGFILAKKYTLIAVAPWVCFGIACLTLGLWRSTIALQGYETLPQRLPLTRHGHETKKPWITKPIDFFERMTSAVIPEPAGSFTNGILLGRDEHISREHIQAFRTTGTAHIFALSGFNITIIATLIAGLLAWVEITPRSRFVACAFFIGIFIISTGAQSSSVRAGVMGMLALLGRVAGRIARIRILLPLAASGMLLVDPLLLRYDRGFQLSFLATFGILVLGTEIKERLHFLPETAAIKETAAATFAATLTTAPLLIAIGNQVGPISIAANMVVGPLIPLAMSFGFIGTLLGTIIPPLAFIIGPIAAMPAQMILGAISLFSRI